MSSRRPRLFGTRFFAAALAVSVVSACRPALLTETVEARRLASELHVEFTKMSEASNRAVMADTDEAASEAADAARRGREIVERDVEVLQDLLVSLGYSDDSRFLEGFKARFDEYRRLDDEILPLAVENTNVKAQRLSFGPAQEAADAFRSALDRALKARSGRDPWQSEALAARAVSALRQIQVLHAPHIAEADLDAMTRMEAQMARSEADARQAVQQLKAVLPSEAAPSLVDTIAALDRFNTIHTELIVLSRRNSDVRSLALSLGRKRVVTAECEDQLQGLEQALSKRAFTATR